MSLKELRSQNKKLGILKRAAALIVAVVVVISVINAVIPKGAKATVETFTTSGSWQAPVGVTSVLVEAWGAGGGGGGTGSTTGDAGGGGGGAYASATVSVTPGNNYSYTVGIGGAAGTSTSDPGDAGGFSQWESGASVKADGGDGGQFNAAYPTLEGGNGFGGSTADSVGTTEYAGGDGFEASASGGYGGGGGGGGAGSTGAGNAGSGVNGGSAKTENGGAGGNSGGTSGDGSIGSNYGGGGGGAGRFSGGNRVGGDGAGGFMRITYSTNATPAAPTLSSPSNSATGVSILPQFQLRTTDADNDYLRYKIEVCSTSNCSAIVRTIDQTSSQTGWSGQDTQTSTAYVGNSTIGSSTMAAHTYQTAALSPNTQYWWRGYAIDPGGANTFSSASSIFSFTTNATPAAPTLSQPSNSATGVDTLPEFQLRTTDADNDYLRYKIEVCDVSDCSSIVRTIDQTSSQTGWSGQDTQTSTAYVGNSSISSSTMAIHTYQTAALDAGTQYWWRAYAIDPGGVNTFSSASSIFSFTTESVGGAGINGGTNLRGGVRLGE